MECERRDCDRLFRTKYLKRASAESRGFFAFVNFLALKLETWIESNYIWE